MIEVYNNFYALEYAEFYLLTQALHSCRFKHLNLSFKFVSFEVENIVASMITKVKLCYFRDLRHYYYYYYYYY